MRRHPPGFGAKAGAPPGDFIFGLNWRTTFGSIVDGPNEVWWDHSRGSGTYNETNGAGQSVEIVYTTSYVVAYSGEGDGSDPRSYGSVDDQMFTGIGVGTFYEFNSVDIVSGNWELSFCGGSNVWASYSGVELYDNKSDADNRTNALIAVDGVFCGAPECVDARGSVKFADGNAWAAGQIPQPFVLPTSGTIVARIYRPSGTNANYVYHRHMRLTKV